MPKKLADLLKSGDALQTEYEALMSTLRSCAKSGTVHEQMISEGTEELDHRIDILLKNGITGKLVSDFVRDPEAKSFATEIENQKAAYIKQCKAYWETRDKLDKLMADCKTTVADATATIAEKKKHLFPSASVAAIQNYKDDLDKWLQDVSAGMRTLRAHNLPKEKRLAWAAPGSTLKTKIDDLRTAQNLHDMAELLQFVETRAKVDKSRANTLKAVRDRLAAVVKASPDA